MNKFSKLFLTLVAFVSIFFAPIGLVHAAGIRNPVGGTTNNFVNTPTVYFSGVIRVVLTILLVAASLYFFYNIVRGGIEWMGSGGDKNKLADARSRVVGAIIGVIIVFGLSMITNFLASVFGIDVFGFNFNDLQVVN